VGSKAGIRGDTEGGRSILNLDMRSQEGGENRQAVSSAFSFYLFKKSTRMDKTSSERRATLQGAETLVNWVWSQKREKHVSAKISGGGGSLSSSLTGGTIGSMKALNPSPMGKCRSITIISEGRAERLKG